MHAVEIVTPSGSVASVRRAVEGVPGVRIVSTPSRRKTRRIIVASVGDLSAREEPLYRFVEDLQGAPLVVVGEGKRAEAGRVAEELSVLGGVAAEPPYFAPDAAALRRVLLARRAGAETKLVASAEVRGETLLVWSCEPRLYRCPLDRLPVVAALRARDRGRVEVSESGSRMHWPAGDVDLDLETVRACLDPELRAAKLRAHREAASRLGLAIRRFREERGLRQTDVPGVSDRELRRLEGGNVMPQAKTLERLAAAHGLEVNAYLQAVIDRQRA